MANVVIVGVTFTPPYINSPLFWAVKYKLDFIDNIPNLGNIITKLCTFFNIPIIQCGNNTLDLLPRSTIKKYIEKILFLWKLIIL